jgi:hypothetical protein
MPVTFQTSSQTPSIWRRSPVKTGEELLRDSCPDESSRCKKIFHSSFDKHPPSPTKHTSPDPNGLVNALFYAYSGHHHLTIRPDDVWTSILTQLNFYINAHADELRSFFVAHEDREELVVIADEAGTIVDVDVGKMAVQMTTLMQNFVVDEELRSWFLPSFTTTSDNDRIVAAVIMMGTLQKYFTYVMVTRCGIPSVTLLGERSDWVDLLAKLEKIHTFGEEPRLFASLLKPVLEAFVASFDQPDSPQMKDFWSKSVHHDAGSGYSHLSGWVTAFCFWNREGKCLYNRDGLELSKSVFPRIDTKDIPPAFISVPVKVEDYAAGRFYDTFMVAGLVGIEATSTPSPTKPARLELNTIRPYSGWWMYEVLGEKELDAKKQSFQQAATRRRY